LPEKKAAGKIDLSRRAGEFFGSVRGSQSSVKVNSSFVLKLLE
jgi:hypothetical protein